MKLLDDGRIQVRVRITGTFRGERWEYVDPDDRDGSQFIWPKDKCWSDDEIVSRYWWYDGNMSCDCNRWKFLPSHLQELCPEENCGEEICIDRIEPVEGDTSLVLVLNDTEERTR